MKYISLFFLVFFIKTNLLAQNIPTYIGTKLEDNGAMGPDEVVTWRYKNYYFFSNTPGIARPITTTVINKVVNGKNVYINNAQLFGDNAIKLLEKINLRLKADFIVSQKEDPLCYKEFYLVGFRELDITVDKNYMYFSIIWDKSFLEDAVNSECIYPSSVAKFDINEIASYIVTY